MFTPSGPEQVRLYLHEIEVAQQQARREALRARVRAHGERMGMIYRRVVRYGAISLIIAICILGRLRFFTIP